MTGRDRKPQAPNVEHLIRQQTDWQDSGARSGSPWQRDPKPYECVPTQKSVKQETPELVECDV